MLDWGQNRRIDYRANPVHAIEDYIAFDLWPRFCQTLSRYPKNLITPGRRRSRVFIDN